MARTSLRRKLELQLKNIEEKQKRALVASSVSALAAMRNSIRQRHHKRTGQLLDAIKVRWDNEWKYHIYVDKNSPAYRYAQILNEGGTIRPRNATHLFIPLKPAMNGRVEKYETPAEAFRAEHLVRETSANGTPFLVKRAGALVERWYVGKSSVTLRASHWWDEGRKAAGEAAQATLGRRATRFKGAK